MTDDIIVFHSACCDMFRVTPRKEPRSCTCEAQRVKLVPALQQRTLLYEEES